MWSITSDCVHLSHGNFLSKHLALCNFWFCNCSNDYHYEIKCETCSSFWGFQPRPGDVQSNHLGNGTSTGRMMEMSRSRGFTLN